MKFNGIDQEVDISEADNMYSALKEDPEKIIAWAKREIREYEKLIKLIESSCKHSNK